MYRYILIAIICFSCTHYNEERPQDPKKSFDYIRYAQGFAVEEINGTYKVVIKKPFQGSENALSYWLFPKGQKIPDSLKSEQVIRIPVENIVVTSTSHIPMLDYLEETSSLAGFPTLDYISSKKMRKRVDSGLVADVGRDNALNFESLVSLNPELVMTYMLTGDKSQLQRIENAEIPVMVNADYLEQHPLGRAEWIKIAGLLFNKKKMADSIFTDIADNYNELAKKVERIDYRPRVMTGIMYGDTWYLPGGENYAANLFEDAGLQYLWEGNEETGFLQLSFEAVYEKAREAEIWIGTASIDKLDVLKNTDSRYTWFNAFKKGKVYTYTKRIGSTGGNEYLELGYLRPDIILADLIKIGHPEMNEDWEFYFYKKVE